MVDGSSDLDVSYALCVSNHVCRALYAFSEFNWLNELMHAYLNPA